MPATFYRWFSERQKELTGYGRARRARTERSRLAMVTRHLQPPGLLLEIGPGQGTLADLARASGWQYRGIDASAVLADALRARGLDIVEAWVPPIPGDDASCDVLYADQVLEHMAGIDAARALVSEARRVVRPGGLFYVVVPDYLKERGFFWDVDYTHNFITTERRVRQLLYDGGFDILEVVRQIGAASGLSCDLLAAGAVLVNIPGTDTLSRWTRTESLLFKTRKNLFQTLAFVARRPTA
jgi:SAM-dependent methyltransferase